MIASIIKLKRKQIVIDIDTQRYFFLDGSIACIRNHRMVLAAVQKTIAWAQLKNIPVISTVQICPDKCWLNCCFPDEYRKKISYTLWNRYISFSATDCTDLPPGLLQRYHQIILQKRCFNPFDEPRADRMLTETQASEFLLIGAVTEGAVKATALGLLARGKKVTVLADAVGSPSRPSAKLALRLMWAKGAEISNTEKLTNH